VRTIAVLPATPRPGRTPGLPGTLPGSGSGGVADNLPVALMVLAATALFLGLASLEASRRRRDEE
jgi:hypothetical protein